MPHDYSTVIGSGSIQSLAHAFPYNVPTGTFPGVSSRNSLRTRVGEGVVVINPEDFSVSIGLRQQVISVGTLATALPASPLEFRRALVIHNNSTDTLYIGGADVTTVNGFPILRNEKIAFDIGGTPNVKVYGISSSTIDIRILELS